jgi:flavorubredoxin
MSANPLPREIADGIFWLGDCMELNFQGETLHSYGSLFLVIGSDASALVEAGHPKDAKVVLDQLDTLLKTGVAPLKYIFTTHQETPHAGGVGVLLNRYPDALLCGDVRDFHLIFPGIDDRLRSLAPGDGVSLGDSTVRVVEAVIRDLDSSKWFFDTRRHMLFPGDGFAYSHYHTRDQCGRVAEEADELPLADLTALYAQLALYWTRFHDIDPFVARLDRMLTDLDVRLVGPTHGLPITDLDRTMPAIRAGLLIGSRGE